MTAGSWSIFKVNKCRYLITREKEGKIERRKHKIQRSHTALTHHDAKNKTKEWKCVSSKRRIRAFAPKLRSKVAKWLRSRLHQFIFRWVSTQNCDESLDAIVAESNVIARKWGISRFVNRLFCGFYFHLAHSQDSELSWVILIANWWNIAEAWIMLACAVAIADGETFHLLFVCCAGQTRKVFSLNRRHKDSKSSWKENKNEQGRPTTLRIHSTAISSTQLCSRWERNFPLKNLLGTQKFSRLFSCKWSERGCTYDTPTTDPDRPANCHHCHPTRTTLHTHNLPIMWMRDEHENANLAWTHRLR